MRRDILFVLATGPLNLRELTEAVGEYLPHAEIFRIRIHAANLEENEYIQIVDDFPTYQLTEKGETWLQQHLNWRQTLRE